jgi:hypothetical protein
MAHQTDEFAAVLTENFNGIEYDPKTRRGHAYIPNVGSITFREPGNEPGVIIELVQTKRFKGTMETAIEFLERLHDAWGNSD